VGRCGIQPWGFCTATRSAGKEEEVWSCSDSLLWVHWVFAQDWEIEECGSWLAVLPQYLPGLVRSGSSYTLDTIPVSLKFRNEVDLARYGGILYLVTFKCQYIIHHLL
jgi:hypothetical protein